MDTISSSPMQTVADQTPGWHKPKDAARQLSISPAYLRKLAHNGLIPVSGQTAGGHRRYSDSDLAHAKTFLRGEQPAVGPGEIALEADAHAQQTNTKPLIDVPSSHRSYDGWIIVLTMVLAGVIFAVWGVADTRAAKRQAHKQLIERQVSGSIEETVAFALDQGYDEIQLRQNQLPTFFRKGVEAKRPQITQAYRHVLLSQRSVSVPRFRLSVGPDELKARGLDPATFEPSQPDEHGIPRRCTQTKANDKPVQLCVTNYGRVLQILL